MGFCDQQWLPSRVSTRGRCVEKPNETEDDRQKPESDTAIETPSSMPDLKASRGLL